MMTAPAPLTSQPRRGRRRLPGAADMVAAVTVLLALAFTSGVPAQAFQTGGDGDAAPEAAANEEVAGNEEAADEGAADESGGANAADAGAAGQAAEAGGEGDVEILTVTITAVQGKARVRRSEEEEWVAVEVGMELTQGAEFQTGLGSVVQFLIPPDQIFTLDRLGRMTVLQAVRGGNVVTADVGMEYGRTRVNVESADLEHDTRIRSPGSTLAVRGTDVTYEDQAPWVPTAVSREGRAQFRNFRREFLAFGGTRRASVAADKSSAAEQGRSNTRVDPTTGFSGRSESENEKLLDTPSYGGQDLETIGVFALLDQARFGTFEGAIVGSVEVDRQLAFEIFYSGTPDTDVMLTVVPPMGPLAIGSGVPTDVEGQNGAKSASFIPFSPGDYKVVLDLTNPNGRAGVNLSVSDIDLKSGGTLFGFQDFPPINLDASNPRAEQTVTVPLPTPPSETPQQQ